jgi:hypothetical protein
MGLLTKAVAIVGVELRFKPLEDALEFGEKLKAFLSGTGGTVSREGGLFLVRLRAGDPELAAHRICQSLNCANA